MSSHQNTTHPLQIRAATRSDAAHLVALIRELAQYEKEPDAAVVTEADILRDGFGPQPYFRAVLAEMDGALAGFALFFFQYSTWEGRPALYLEDLFVREPYRQRGIGKRLLQHLAHIALDHHCTRLQWECLAWNQPSLDFYESIGAKVMREWLNLRLTTAETVALAQTPASET